MKAVKYINSKLFFSLIFTLICSSCQHNEELKTAIETREITLKWNQAYSTETREQIDIGIRWYLSFLGATLPTETSMKGIDWVASDKVTLHFSELGFTEEAIRALERIAQEVKKSEEYQKNGFVDIGRWIMLTLNSSHHYYAITGVYKTYDEFRNAYSFRDSSFVTEESTVSKNNRKINLPSFFGIGNGGFIANEGIGSIRNGTFVKHANEVFDIMPNGQLRFAVYDESGKLKTSSDTMYSDAGKPAKCLWCHEVNIQPPHGATIDVPGYYSINTFKSIVMQNMEILGKYRAKLTRGVDFSQRQAHTQTELLYITFMEPSAMKLAGEWGISEQEVKTRLRSLATHQYGEFPFLGELYYRNEVEPFAPFNVLKVPDFAREPSTYEPNFLP